MNGGHTPVRVLLADDHPVVRQGLRAVLELDPRLEVVADVSTTGEAVELAEQVDVVLMDLQFGDRIEGIEATRTITTRPRAPRVLVLTTYGAEADVLAAVEAGASGYLLKTADPAALIDAVVRSAAGETVLAPEVAARLVQRARQPGVTLTGRELEVLRLVGEGLSNAAIAAELFLSRATVKTHLVHIFTKLDVDSRTAAVARAQELGLLRR